MRSARGVVDKASLRRAALSRRAALPPAERARIARTAVAALVPEAGRGPVAAYLSVGTEPGTAPLLAALRGLEVLLPVLLDDDDLDWARAGPGVEPGRHGLLEPVGPRLGRDALAACVLVVVPALAVDPTGTRLGRGGGSYDRALPRTRGQVVALLHDGELLPALPRDEHDAPVHAVVTPTPGLVRLRPHQPDGPSHPHPGAT